MPRPLLAELAAQALHHGDVAAPVLGRCCPGVVHGAAKLVRGVRGEGLVRIGCATGRATQWELCGGGEDSGDFHAGVELHDDGGEDCVVGEE